MKTKNALVLSALLLTTFSVSAQLDHFCGHSAKMAQLPVPPRADAYENTDPVRSTYIIPVVFHVLHVGGAENVSDAQINNTLMAINEDFNKLNADRSQVIPEFANNVANIGVRLQLANFDPNGNPTTGIERIYTTLTNHGIDDSAKINQWPQNRYLNIWVVKDLGGSAAAVSFYPYYAQFYPQLDGIVCQYNYLGFSGAASSISRHAMSHEVGHFLNLLHPFDNVIGSGPCGDDDVADTPITQSSGCDLTLSGCNPPVVENVQNFMTGSYCFVMFTEGQKSRMVTCLNSDEGGRRNLWQNQNLEETLGPNYLSLDEMESERLSVYPNPASEQLAVKNHSDEALAVQLNDLFGKTVWSGVIEAGKSLQIDVTGFAKGVYVLNSSNGSTTGSQLISVAK